MCCQVKQDYLKKEGKSTCSKGCCIIKIVYYRSRIPQSTNDYIPTGHFDPIEVVYLEQHCEQTALMEEPLPSIKGRVIVKTPY